MPTLVGNKHLSIHFIERVFFIFRQKNVRVQSVKNGHQSGYSCADTVNDNINKRSKGFSIRGNY